MKKFLSLLLAAFALIAVSTGRAPAAEVKVFAAASLTNVLQDLAKNFETQSGDKIIFNFAGSNILARQIVQGAPAEIFLSADEKQMDVVAKAGLLADGTRRDLLGNTLVVVVPADSTLTMKAPGDLAQPGFKRIALADPATVPAGVYAKAYLEKENVWSSVQDRVAPTQNVRAALAAVASGNADVGIVYKTDALISKGTKTIYEIPAADGPKILYPLALIKSDAAANPEAEKFLKYLESPDAGKVFVQYGFSVITP